MKSPSTKQIEFLARAIVNRLEDRGLVEFGDAERGIEVVRLELEARFHVAEEIEREARARLAAELSRRDPTDEEVEAEIEKLAVERNVIL